MALGNVSPVQPVFNLNFGEVDSETSKVLTAAAYLAAKNPSILAAVAADQDAHGLRKIGTGCIVSGPIQRWTEYCRKIK